MRYAGRLFVFLCLCALCAPSQEGKPDLSGVWRKADFWVRIEQQGADINITLRTRNNGVEETNREHLQIGADNNKNEMHGAPMTSKAVWDGDTLAVDSVAKFRDGDLRMNDRWTLSADRRTLTFSERHQFGGEPKPGENTTEFERQPDGSWEASQSVTPAEQAYKNIQVMKGVPAPRLMDAMTFFKKSLGVECQYCHVPGAFEKDDKPAKNVARAMLKMVHQINEGNFPDKQDVSCWMCHRGSARPETRPN